MHKEIDLRVAIKVATISFPDLARESELEKEMILSGPSSSLRYLVENVSGSHMT